MYLEKPGRRSQISPSWLNSKCTFGPLEFKKLKAQQIKGTTKWPSIDDIHKILDLKFIISVGCKSFFYEEYPPSGPM